MERPKLLVLVRHGESMRNKAKDRKGVYFADDEARQAIRGIPDHKIDLTSEGVRQAQLTGMGLREDFGTFDYAYHSGYARTIQTLAGIMEAYSPSERADMKVRANPFIRERDSGHAYDMTKAEAEKSFPYLKEHWDTYGGFFARPPGGESLAQVVERVYLFLGMLFRDRARQKVLVTTHGGTKRCFRYLLERWNYEQALNWDGGVAPHNCGVTVYRYSPADRRLVLADYNKIYY